MSKVAIVRCGDYSQETVDASIAKAAAASDFPDVRGKKVLLKPNILSDSLPEKGITTNPSVLRGMIRFLRGKGAAAILVGDSPGLQGPNWRPRESGIEQVIEEEGCEWVDFTRDTVTEDVPYTGGMKLPFSSIFSGIDVFITLPKFKTHKLMYATGALKNQFGLVPSVRKSACHVQKTGRDDFARLIVGINTLHKPSYALMDAVIGMEGDGPANGTLRFMGLLIGSDDPVALDRTEGLLMGYDPGDLPIVREAEKAGLGGNPRYTVLLPEEVAKKDWKKIPITKKSHFFRDLALPFLSRSLHLARKDAEAKARPAPVFGSPDCILCKRCVQICPAHALTVKGKQIVIETRACVRCYCCHEICPRNAISIKEKP